MKRTWTVVFCGAFLAGAAALAAAEQVGEPTKVTMANGQVSMILPAEFTELSKEELATKFPRQNAPGRAFGNERRTVTVGGGLVEIPMTIDQLPEAQKGMAEGMTRSMPGLEWRVQEIITINGHQWIHYSMISTAPDSKIRNEMFVTSVGGKAFIVNLNATVGEYAKYEKAIDAIRRSMRVSAGTSAR